MSNDIAVVLPFDRLCTVVQEGIYGWVEIEYITEFDVEEYYCGYVYLQPNSHMEIINISDVINRMIDLPE